MVQNINYEEKIGYLLVNILSTTKYCKYYTCIYRELKLITGLDLSWN